MAELDLSKHSLNLSGSKQKYSFPKTHRFNDRNRPLCDSLYELPSMFSKRATSLGIGNKKIQEVDKLNSPGAGTYNLPTDINPEKSMRKSISFGVSRENMDITGPLGNVRKFLQKLPGPGNYEAKNVHDYRSPALRSRLPDHSADAVTKNPGPGTYNHESMKDKNYYMNSRYRQAGSGSISALGRVDNSAKKPVISPAEYKPVDSMNSVGAFHLAKHQSAASCRFGRSERQGIVEKQVITNPGPGTYKAFSGFG